MKMRLYIPGLLAVMVLFAGCASKPYDYANFRAHSPRSILVLPPLNDSTDVRATYACLSTITMPIAEMGYYVFPVAVVDQVMKENGLPTAGEMHQVSLEKIHEVVGADAVLYVNIKQYGSKYVLINSVTTVSVEGKLVDVKTGTLLWEGKGMFQESSSSGNIFVDLVAAPIKQAVNSATDAGHEVSRVANCQLIMVKDHGFLPGPYFPKDKAN